MVTYHDHLSIILGDHTLGLNGGGGKVGAGTTADETFLTSDGNDILVGAGGDDILTGGLGEDALFGDGYDTLLSGVAGSYDDTLSGGAGNDLLVGGMGNDALSGGDGADVLFGDTFGDDQGTHGWGTGWEDPAFDADSGKGAGGASFNFDDFISGGSGADYIYGQLGNDVLHGNEGADTIRGGVGNDTIYGGQADDTPTEVTVLSENFDNSDGGFAYADGAFRGTTAGTYESGTYDAGNGEISVSLGGINGDDILGMSGGFNKSFTVDSSSTSTQITFQYRLQMSSEFEADEYGEVLISIDGQLYGLGGNDYIVRQAGDGNGGSNYDSGFVEVTVDLGTLAAGNHTLTLGGFLNKKTFTDEDIEVSFTEVEIKGTQLTDDTDTSDDTLFGDSGDDTIFGQEGNDTIDGGSGADTIDGGAGNDILTGGAQDTVATITEVLNENFTSNDGGFTYSDGHFRGAGTTDYSDGAYDGGAGELAIVLGGDDTPDEHDMAGAFTKSFSVSEATTSSSLSFTYRLVHNDGFESDEYSEVLVEIDGQLYGLNGNDYIDRAYGDGQNNNSFYDSGWVTVNIDISDLAVGNHTVKLGGYLNKSTHYEETSEIKFTDVKIEGVQSVTEEDGADTISGGLGDDIISGNDGDDILDGGAGNDTITGGAGLQDTLTGGAGNDTLTDADGVLEAHGGDGNDVINITFDAGWDDDANGATDPASTNRISGGTGADIITVTMASLGFAIALDADEAVADIDDGNDTVTLLGLYDTSTIDLGGGNDIFIGGNGKDTVDGGLGNDNIRGGNGADVLIGGDGNDRLRGQGGADNLSGGAGVDRLQGGGGRDILDGGAGADRLEGGGGADTLFFDPGAALLLGDETVFELEDTKVTGGNGIDTLQGSTGADYINFNDTRLFTDIEIVRAGAGDDYIIGRLDTSLADQFLVFGGDGDDLVSFFAVTTANFDLSHINPAFNSTTGTWTIDYTGNGAKSISLTQAEIVASVGGDVGNWDPSAGLSGNFPGSPNFLSANYIDGGSGSNTLFGSEGSDIIFGGINTTDDMTFANVDDKIYANGGNDILIGGSGYDTYYIARDGGDNFIFDGNTKLGGGSANAQYSNGLVFFEGFEGNDNVTIDYEDEQANDLGVGTADVSFVNNNDGTWTISFTSSTGSVTFAGHEISDINLQDNKAGGTGGITKAYSFNDQGTATFADDTYDLTP